MTRYTDYSSADDYDAKREGWALFECDDGKLRIQRLDDPRQIADDMPEAPMFDDDDTAILYVRVKAAKGSAMHKRALALHTTEVQS